MNGVLPDWEGEDALLARSVFGTSDRADAYDMIADWLESRYGMTGRVLSMEISVGAAAPVEMADGSKAFIKIWPRGTEPAALTAQLRLQRLLSQKGFPAPALLKEPAPLGPGIAALMGYDRSGEPTDVRIPGVRDAMARGLAQFVAAAREFSALPHLPRKQLPSGQSWPKPHNALFDFQATTQGAEWIDRIAAEALAVMREAQGEIVVGHHDWSAKNMRMGKDRLAVVYDWDAVFVDRETFFIGGAAAHFPVTWELPVPGTPTPEEILAFIRAYEQERPHPFTAAECREIAASLNYTRAYTARCEHSIDSGNEKRHGSSREALKKAPFRLDQLRP